VTWRAWPLFEPAELAVAAAGEERDVEEVAEGGGTGVQEPGDLGPGQVANHRQVDRFERLDAAPGVIGSNEAGTPGLVERALQIGQQPVGGGAPSPHRIRVLAVKDRKVRLGAVAGAPTARPLRDRAMPVGEPLGGELADFGVAKRAKNVLARDARNAVGGLAAAAPIILEVVCHCASHRIGSAGCRTLRLRKVEHAIAVAVLEIIGQAKLGLAIEAALVAAACDPGAAGGAAAIAEMQSLLDDAPVRFGIDRKPQAGAARCQTRLADGARHVLSSILAMPLSAKRFLSAALV